MGLLRALVWSESLLEEHVKWLALPVVTGIESRRQRVKKVPSEFWEPGHISFLVSLAMASS